MNFSGHNKRLWEIFACDYSSRIIFLDKKTRLYIVDNIMIGSIRCHQMMTLQIEGLIAREKKHI